MLNPGISQVGTICNLREQGADARNLMRLRVKRCQRKIVFRELGSSLLRERNRMCSV